MLRFTFSDGSVGDVSAEEALRASARQLRELARIGHPDAQRLLAEAQAQETTVQFLVAERMRDELRETQAAERSRAARVAYRHEASGRRRPLPVDWLARIDKAIDENPTLSDRAIGTLVGCSHTTIGQRRRERGLSRPHGRKRS